MDGETRQKLYTIPLRRQQQQQPPQQRK